MLKPVDGLQGGIDSVRGLLHGKLIGALGAFLGQEFCHTHVAFQLKSVLSSSDLRRQLMVLSSLRVEQQLILAEPAHKLAKVELLLVEVVLGLPAFLYVVCSTLILVFLLTAGASLVRAAIVLITLVGARARVVRIGGNHLRQ